MNLLEELKENGVDVDEGIERMMGNTDLYQKLLAMLVKMVREFTAAFEADSLDNSEVIKKVHEIKGSTGNLSVTPLYRAYTEMLTLLREEKPKRARAVFEEVLPVQDKILACIEKYM